jgi:hypothetical protein
MVISNVINSARTLPDIFVTFTNPATIYIKTAPFKAKGIHEPRTRDSSVFPHKYDELNP